MATSKDKTPTPPPPKKPGDPGFIGPVASSSSTPTSTASNTQTKPNVTYIPAVTAVNRGKLQVGSDEFTEHCDKYVENSILGHTGVYDSAKQYYNWAKNRNWVKTTVPPAGVAVFYAGNADNGYGHVALSAGNGYVYSTDVNGNNTGQVRYDKLWGGTGSGEYLGWTSAIKTKRNGGDVAYVDYDPSSIGNAQNINTATVDSSSSQTGTGDAVKPAPAPAPAPAPQTSSSNRGMFGSLFGSIFGSMSQPSSTVAQGTARSSINPTMSAQFDSHIPTMDEVTSSSNTTSLDSATEPENVTVDPVGG